jgi:hypothetical protein
LIPEAQILQQKFAELLDWEKLKRRWEILASACCYSLLAAIVVLPFQGLFPMVSRGLGPLVILAILIPVFFFKRRWQSQDSVRALANLDKTLRLDERAVTAWEILARQGQSPAEGLVVTQASDRVKSLQFKTLFERQLSWRDYSIIPLFGLWLVLVWLDVGLPPNHDTRPVARTLAHQVREFSRELQDRAKRDGLSDSLKMGRELEQAAQKGIDEKSNNEKFKSELAGLANKMAAMGKATADPQAQTAAESDQTLKDLKSELEAAKGLLNSPELAKAAGESQQQWLDQLSMMPQLKRQLESGGQTIGQDQVKSFLDKLNKQVTGELERRTLLEAQQFLEQMMKQGQERPADSNVQMAGRGQREEPGGDEKEQSRSNLPGKEPGKNQSDSRSLPEFQAGAAAHIKGMLNEGNSDGVVFKGKPSAGKTEVSQEEVLASYRRQAEAELDTERVPQALKETIRNYFLSLGGKDSGRKE